MNKQNDNILHIVPDTEVMSRELFINLLKKYRHHRNLSYAFSKKHTQDITNYRKNIGVSGNVIPHNLYDLRVEWDAEQTCIKQG